MASVSSIKLILLFTLFCSLHLLSAAASEFEVGESNGWAVPSSDDIGFYNEWASEKRFQVGDTIVFQYKKDSVMVVIEDDYDKCNSSHPVYYANEGPTVYEFDRPGPFYFISGVSSHCEKGQKIIIKVLSQDDSPHPHGGQDTNSSPNPPEPSATAPRARVSYLLIPSQFMTLFLGFLFRQFF